MAVLFHKLHILKLHARHRRADGHRTCGENEPVIALGNGRSVLRARSDPLCGKVDMHHFCFHMHGGALLLKGLLRGIKQPAGAAYLPAYPQCHAAAQKADGAAAVKHYHMLVLVIVQYGIDGGRARVGRTYHHNSFAHDKPSQKI